MTTAFRTLDGKRESGQWESRSVGSSLQHRVFYFLVRYFGRRAAYLLLYPVVGYYVFLRPAQRKKSEYYLSRRFSGRNLPQRLADSYRLTLSLGKVLVDRAIVGILGGDKLDVRFDDGEQLLDLLAEGRGLILLTAHVGCWQVALPALSYVRVPVNILLRREEGDVDRHYFEHRGLPCPFNIIDPNGYLGGTLEMLQVLKRGEVLTVMGDRVFGSGKNVVAVDFLGGRIPLPYSHFKIASVTGAPVGVVFSSKTGPRSYKLELAGVIRVAPGEGRKKESFRKYAAEFAAALEEYVGRNPWQFFNFFDMWNERSPAAGAVRAVDGEHLEGGSHTE